MLGLLQRYGSPQIHLLTVRIRHRIAAAHRKYRLRRRGFTGADAA